MNDEYERELKASYFDWLVDLVRMQENLIMMRTLHSIEFYALIDLDNNRGEDGKQLREVFAEKHPEFGNYEALNGPCTMLEMMIALCIRMEEIARKTTFQKLLCHFFTEICTNLGIFNCKNPDEISEKVHCFLEKKPLKGRFVSFFWHNVSFLKSKMTQEYLEKTEIWYQMQAYLQEKDPF